jgi:hypothetical protein
MATRKSATDPRALVRRGVIAGAVLAATASVAVTVGATPAQAEEPQWAGNIIRTAQWYRLTPLRMLTRNIDCPNTHPYLINEHLAPGRFLPKGISVEEPGGVTVSGDDHHENGRVIGVKNLAMLNWGAPTTTNIVLHCSDNAADGY